MADTKQEQETETTTASLIARVVLSGKLVLASPLRIGTGIEGAGNREADIYVLKDEQGCPFIPGSSLAGVLRAWMTETQGAELAKAFFGDERASHGKNEDDGLQSSLDVRDIALRAADGTAAPIVLRDGVCLQESTGTAKQGGKFNYEAVERGACGTFELTLTLRRYHEPQFDAMLAGMQAMAGAIRSGIHLGSLTSLGFGRTLGKDLHLYVYDFRKSRTAAAAWLCREPYGEVALPEQAERQIPRGAFQVEAAFFLKTPLLVRLRTEEKLASELTVTAKPLESGDAFVLPGASLKGVLRHRAARILRKLGWKDADAALWLEDLMGTAGNDRDKQAKKSRLRVEESYMERKDGRTKAAAQARLHADRFTGGVMHLFGEKAVFQQGDAPALTLSYMVRPAKAEAAPRPGDIGLALLLLKDLWLGDVALGGDKSIGRGRLQGCAATLRYLDADGKEQTWELDADGALATGDAAPLDAWVQEPGALAGSRG